jgi:hypothetical protein
LSRSTRYRNTDLEVTSPSDLQLLADALTAQGVLQLAVVSGDDGEWHATFETETVFSEPETNIVAMLDAIESLPSPIRAMWNECSKREFNVGYDCGLEPPSFTQALSESTLGRIAALGATLRLTLYAVELSE